MFLYKLVTLLKLSRYSFYDLTIENSNFFHACLHILAFWGVNSCIMGILKIFRFNSIYLDVYIAYKAYSMSFLAASWRKQLDARLPPLGSRVRVWVSWWTKRGLGRFFTGFLPFSPTTNFISPCLHTHSSISFHFIRPCDGVSGVVGRHPCYSRTYNIGASSHLIPRPILVLDTS